MQNDPYTSPDLIHLHFLQDSFGFALHPERRQWVFVSKWGNSPDHGTADVPGEIVAEPTADLMLMPQDGGFSQNLGLLHQASLGAPCWSPDGQSLAWAGAKGVYVYHLPSHQLKRLDARTVCQIDANKMCASAAQLYFHPLWHPLLWHPDSGSLFYVIQDEESQILYEASIDGKLLRQRYKADGQIMAKAISPLSHELALSVRFWDGSSGEILRIDRDERLSRVCELRHEFYLSSLVSYTDDERLVYRANHGGFAQLWLQNPDGKLECLDPEPVDVTSYLIAGHQVFYVQSGPDCQDGLACLDLKTRQRTILLTPQPSALMLLAATAGSLYLYKSSVDLPGELVAYHWQQSAWQILTHSHPLRWHHHPVRAEFLTGPSPTMIYYPPDFDPARSYPALIWIKGGPTSSVRQAYQAWPQWLAREGYVVACPNYRGSTGFGVAHMEAGALGQAGQTDLEDIRALGEAMKALPYVAADKLGVLGHSWGGYLTLMAVTRYPELFAAAMASAGLYHLAQQQLLEDVRHYTYWLYGGWSYELRERYAARSPLSQVAQIKTPLLLFHGKSDPNVPFAQLQGFVDGAKAAGVKLETHFFEGEGHSYRRTAHRRLFYGRALQFLDTHLKVWDFKRIPQRGQHLE